MGADLYISQLFDPHCKKWQARFDEAVVQRNRLQESTPEYEAAQKRVEECYDRMYEKGYFRDSYNDSDLLWRFELSWWADIIPMLNARSQLTIERVRLLLAMLKQREAVFEQSLVEASREEQQYFRQKYLLLKGFLNQAIQLGAPIDCSL